MESDKVEPFCCGGCLRITNAAIMVGILDMLHPVAIITLILIDGTCQDKEFRSMILCGAGVFYSIIRFVWSCFLIKGCREKDYIRVAEWVASQYKIVLLLLVVGFIGPIIGAIVSQDSHGLIIPAIVGVYLIILGIGIRIVRQMALFLQPPRSDDAPLELDFFGRMRNLGCCGCGEKERAAMGRNANIYRV